MKLSCLTDTVYLDELENEELGIAETFLDQNIIAPNARPGTSFQRPITTAKGMNPIMRPTSTAGRPLSGVNRPMTSLRLGTMEQAVRTSRTARTARAVSSNTARQLRLGTDVEIAQSSKISQVHSEAIQKPLPPARDLASMRIGLSPAKNHPEGGYCLLKASMASNSDGSFVNLSRLNVDKYASDPMVNRQLFEYVFYYEADMKIAHQIASVATKAANYEDWYWKNQLGKCYMRFGLFHDAEKQFLSSLNNHRLPETYAYLAKVYSRLDQPLMSNKFYEQGLMVFQDDVTLLTGLARNKELLGELSESNECYKKILIMQANNIEAIACIATNYYYGDKPEIALCYYRRIMQMGVNNAELMMNIGLCCFACQQFDFALSSVQRAHSTASDDIAGEIWYNTGHIMLAIGDTRQASRCFRLALAADSEHGEAMTNLGILEQREGKLDQARSLYHSAISKSPHLFEPHFNLALLCSQIGRYDEAYRMIKIALSIFPNHTHSKQLFKTLHQLYTAI
ncbi:tetratricopeptide repeat protein [Dictyocaulus viviparus]|uniref:Tetratricopeptide repeat protein n=1 Tax=Dictyocaulus viviparus TaxID=29172 RepID=A0A0D8Y0V9_DICVI|nr:tetratricopeptide repeat protein [Dictyocaulus viviparus]